MNFGIQVYSSIFKDATDPDIMCDIGSRRMSSAKRECISQVHKYSDPFINMNKNKTRQNI